MEGETVLLIFGLIILWIILKITYPVSLWLGIAALGTWMIFIIYRKLKTRLEGKKIEFRAQLLMNVVQAIREVSLCVSVGIGIVFLAQFMLVSASYFVNLKTVSVWEDRLSVFSRFLTKYFGLRYLLITLAVLLVFSIIRPRLSLVTRYLKARQWGTRGVMIISTLTSFTFFSSASIQGFEAKWVASLKEKAQSPLASVVRVEKELVATSLLEDRIRGLPPRTRVDLAKLFHAADENAKTKEIIDVVARRVAQNAPKLTKNAHSQESKNQSNISAYDIPQSFEKVKAWLQGEPGTQDVSLSELRSFPKHAGEVEDRLVEAKAAAIEAVSSILESSLKIELHTISKQFVTKLVGTLAQTSLAEILPKNINDLATARLWFQLNFKSPEASKSFYRQQQQWGWEVRSEGISKTEPSQRAMEETVNVISKDLLAAERKRVSERTYKIWPNEPIPHRGMMPIVKRPTPRPRPRPRPGARR